MTVTNSIPSGEAKTNSVHAESSIKKTESSQAMKDYVLGKGARISLITCLVFTILSFLTMLGAMGFLLFSGVPLCSVGCVVSWIFLGGVAASLFSTMLLLTLNTAFLCQMKKRPNTSAIVHI